MRCTIRPYHEIFLIFFTMCSKNCNGFEGGRENYSFWYLALGTQYFFIIALLTEFLSVSTKTNHPERAIMMMINH